MATSGEPSPSDVRVAVLGRHASELAVPAHQRGDEGLLAQAGEVARIERVVTDEEDGADAGARALADERLDGCRLRHAAAEAIVRVLHVHHPRPVTVRFLQRGDAARLIREGGMGHDQVIGACTRW